MVANENNKVKYIEMENKIRNRFALDSMDLEFALEILEDYGYQDLKLTNKRKMILATLLYINGIDEKDEDGYFFVENDFLSNLIGMSKRALITSLQYLQSVGLIERISGKRGSASLYKVQKTSPITSPINFTHNIVDNQEVRELRTENFTHNLSKTSPINFTHNLENFTPDIDTDIEEDKDIDKEIEIKKEIDKNNINNILINYILNLNNIINNLNNNILYIKEKNNKKEKEIEELNLKLEALIQKVDNMNNLNNNKDNFEINMKKENLKENITPSQDVLEMILAKLTSIETRITSIEEEIKSLKGQNCAVTLDNTSSNIITPTEEDNAAEAKEMMSEAIHINPMEIAKAVFAKNDKEFEKRSIPTFVDCDVKLEKKDTESSTKAFRSDLTVSNDVSGVIVPQAENKPLETKEMSDKPMSDEEWDKFVQEVDSKSSSKKNVTRDVMGSYVASGTTQEGWIDGVKHFNSEQEIYDEIAELKRKGLDIMQISTRFATNWKEYTMTDKLYTPSKVSNQIDVKKEENITPSEVKTEVNKVTGVVAKVNKDTEKTAVEEVNNYTEENVYYAKTNTAKFERENDDFTSTEAALDNIFSSDYDDEEVTPSNKLQEELARRKSEQAVEVPF